MQIDGLVLEALAEIVHGDATTGYGVKFVVVDPAGEQRLRHFVTAAAHAVFGAGLGLTVRKLGRSPELPPPAAIQVG